MKTVLIIVLSFLAGSIAGFTVSTIWYHRTISILRAKVKELRRGDAHPGARLEPVVKMETMKKFVWFCEINGVAWVWCSYILAWEERTQIVEDLSKVALVEIIAPLVVYGGKSLIENMSKHNHWPDKHPVAPQPESDKSDSDAPGDVEAMG